MTFGVTRVVLRDGRRCSTCVRRPAACSPSATPDRPPAWAGTTPERTFWRAASDRQMVPTGDWRHVSYARRWPVLRSIGQALLDRGLKRRATGW